VRVAIIGGGFCGMLAAYLLEQKGIKATVFERENTLGGHCQTYVSKNFRVELGTAFFLNDHIEELLTELDVAYTERHSYRDFVDKNHARVSLLPKCDIPNLIAELTRLETLLSRYSDQSDQTTYGHVHEELNVSTSEFLAQHDFRAIGQAIKPHLSAYGFGSIHKIQAYYAFNALDVPTINLFVRGDKLLFINEGTANIIAKLSRHISDIRHAEVTHITPHGSGVQIAHHYGTDTFDKVLISTGLPHTAIGDAECSDFMRRVTTNEYTSCAFEIGNKNRVTTYYLDNLGQLNKLQFFHAYRQKDRTIAVAYAYGLLNKNLANSIQREMLESGLTVKHIIAAKQWHIFPHMRAEDLGPTVYTNLQKNRGSKHIHLIGSLVAKPSISHLYLSVKRFIQEVF